jgi:preprotein translocase YajC subunit
MSSLAVLIPVAFTCSQDPQTKPEPARRTDAPAPAGQGNATAEKPAGGQGATPGSPCALDQSSILMFGGLFLLMYLLILRPESKRRKEAQQMLAKLQAGDRVVTTGGIHGVVASIADTTITLRIDASSAAKIVVDRAAIGRVLRDEPAKPKPDADKNGK